MTESQKNLSFSDKDLLVNTEQKLCIHVCKCKNDTAENVPGMGGRITENGRG
jgi:hypothetical protein